MNNLDKQYISLLQDILDNGIKKEDRTGTGTLSVFGRQIRHKMSEGFPLLTTKKMYFKGVVTELLWFLRGDTRIGFLHDNDCHIWDGDAYKKYSQWVDRNNEITPFEPTPKLSLEDFVKAIGISSQFADSWGDLGPIYGKQWRRWGTYPNSEGEYESNPIDQIANLIHDLKTNPDSRRLMVSAWNVGELDSMTLPPCHYGFQVYTREFSLSERQTILEKRGYKGLLHSNVKNYKSHKKILEVIKQTCDDVTIPTRAISLMWNQRSVDTFLGLPFNIASYGLLLEIIAKEVNMVPDELIGNLGDTHLYANHTEQAMEQIGREPYPLPKLLCLDEYHYLTDEELVGVIPFTEKIEKFRPDFFTMGDYQSHSSIKAPLSN